MLLELHVPSILLQGALALAAVAMGMGLVAWRARQPYLIHWAAGLAVSLLGLVLFGLRGLVPNWLSMIGGNLALTGGLLLTLAGYLCLFGRRLQPKIWICLGLLAALGYLLLTYGYDTYVGRVMLFNSTLTLQSGACLVLLWDERKRMSRIALAMPALAHVLQGSLGLIRIGLTLHDGGGAQDLLAASTPHVVTMMVSTLGIMAMGFGFMALHSSKLIETLEAQAGTDALTGVLNRRGFDNASAQAWKRHRRTGAALTVLMIDIDHFKRINDTLGHAAGDEALRLLGSVIQQHIRPYDIAARLGGEEFCVLLVDAGLDAAAPSAERLRQVPLRLAPMAGQPNDPDRMTLSIGVAQASGHDLDLAAVMARADSALYRAKQSGRNRVEVHRVSS
jgi:diguanylate cyclase (GGDEF)-like protein